MIDEGLYFVYRINNSKIKHNQIYLNIDENHIHNVVMFLKTNVNFILTDDKFLKKLNLRIADTGIFK